MSLSSNIPPHPRNAGRNSRILRFGSPGTQGLGEKKEKEKEKGKRKKEMIKASSANKLTNNRFPPTLYLFYCLYSGTDHHSKSIQFKTSKVRKGVGDIGSEKDGGGDKGIMGEERKERRRKREKEKKKEWIAGGTHDTSTDT